MTVSKPVDDAQVWMSGDYGSSDLSIRHAIVREGLSQLSEITMVFQSEKPDMDMTEFLGKELKIHLETGDGVEREFGGICASIESLGFRSGFYQFVAEIKPRFWLLTRSSDCRVFQNMTTEEIVTQILNDHGLTEFKFKLGEQYRKRQYCVQFNETHYAFICRLLEQEGMYFYFDTKSGYKEPDELTFCDGKTSHKWDTSVEYAQRGSGDFARRQISEWAPSRSIQTGKVTLDDYEFLTPKANKSATETTSTNATPQCTAEEYRFPGHFRAEGDKPSDVTIKKEAEWATARARVRLEAELVKHRVWRGASSVQTLGAGRLFEMTGHPEDAVNTEYLVTKAVHYINASMDIKDDSDDFDLKPQNFDLPEGKQGTTYSAEIEAIEASIQYRAPLVTPWPLITGLQTALVVGPSGEEIWTDDYGRIRVQFHWDRKGQKDENSSCWIRVVTPWAGKYWGFSAVPRIGQEVVVQFEDGNPNRPICTGMLYNEDNPKFYSKKETSTQIGLRTDSTKSVSDAQAFNELMFEDKSGSELMRVQAQKDHQFLTKNISRIGVGLSTAADLKDYNFNHAEDGSLLQVVQNHFEEEVIEGDHYYTISTGSQEKVIHKDFKSTIETGNHETTVQQGDHSTTIDKGKHDTTVSTGNMSTTVSKGNLSVSVDMGKIEIEAKQKIVLKVGPSTITLDPSGIKIKGPMLKLEGTGMAELKSKMTTVKGDAMTVVKGGVTMVN